MDLMVQENGRTVVYKNAQLSEYRMETAWDRLVDAKRDDYYNEPPSQNRTTQITAGSVPAGIISHFTAAVGHVKDSVII